MDNFYKIFFAAVLLAAFSNSFAARQTRAEKKAARAAAAASMSPEIARDVNTRSKAKKASLAAPTTENTEPVVVPTTEQLRTSSAFSRFSIGGIRSTKFIGTAAALAIVGLAIYKNQDAIKRALGYTDTIESLTAKIDVINTEIQELAKNKVENKAKIESLNQELDKLKAKFNALKIDEVDEEIVI